jgi:hypothetical protein
MLLNDRLCRKRPRFRLQELCKFNKFRLLTVGIVVSCVCPAQQNWTYDAQVNVGCNLSLYKGHKQSFPGLKVFAGISVNCVYKGHFFINYSPSFGCYTRSLGNNLNPLVHDIQLDFTNAFMAGGAWGDSAQYVKYFRTLNNVPFNSMFMQRDYAIYLGTNLLWNNHRRNQAIGSLGFSIQRITINYSNDGPPFGVFGLGDSFDRWWTGHGCIYFHSKRDYNYAELGFDQFTGYSPLLYELSGLLGINIPDYNIEYKNDSLPEGAGRRIHNYEYNSSTYNLRINFDANYGLDMGCIGSLKSNRDRYFGVQDLIHNNRKFSLHPNQDLNRFFIGPTYRYTSHVQ